MSLPFFIVAVITLGGAVAAMTLQKLVHCVLALTVAFAGLAGLYLALGAQFVGLAQILVYIGAVAILIVFAILLTRDEPLESGESSQPFSRAVSGGVIATAVFALLAWSVLHSIAAKTGNTPVPRAGVKQIGDALMQHFALPLEVVGLMLTAALIGAVILARQEKSDAQ